MLLIHIYPTYISTLLAKEKDENSNMIYFDIKIMKKLSLFYHLFAVTSSRFSYIEELFMCKMT